MTRALWLPEAIRAEGVTVKVVPGWRTRGRDFRGGRGVVHHHTAAGFSSSPTPSLRIVTEGRSDLPGPLAQLLVGRDLTCWVVAAGRANHAGLGGPWRTIPRNSANEFTIGVEVENNGINEPWRPEMLDVCTRIFAAVLKAQKNDASFLIGHKEWTPRKIDPWCCDGSGNVQMDRMRLRVKDYMSGGGDDDMSMNEFIEGIEFAAQNPGREKPPAGKSRYFNHGFRLFRRAAEGRHPHPYAAAADLAKHVMDHPSSGRPHNHPGLADQKHVHETGPAK